MTRTRRKIIIILSSITLLVGVVWVIDKPSYGSITFCLSSAVVLFSFWWPLPRKKYTQKCLKDIISFNYSNDDGRHSIGNDNLLFETAWSKASDTSIHIYNDPPSIDGIAVVRNKPNISDIRDASTFDFSSRTRTPEEGDIVILKNKYGNYAVLKITDIKDSSRSDEVDEVTFEYVINPDGYSDFK